MSVRELESVAREFGPRATRRKLGLLAGISRLDGIPARDLLSLRDTLNFMRAYPDDTRVHELVLDQIARLRSRSRSFDGRAGGATLVNTGFPGSHNTHPYSYPVLQRMTALYPGCLEIDWDQLEDDGPLTDAVIQTVCPSEIQGLEDIELSFPDWLAQGKHDPEQTDLEFVLELFEKSDLSEAQQAHLFESCEAPVKCELSAPGSGLGEIEFPIGKIHHQKHPLDRSRPPLRPVIRRPLAAHQRLSPTAGRRLLDLALVELCSRNLEIYPLSYAHPADVTEIEAGRGFRIYLAGVLTEHRSTFDSLYFFLIVKNGVAIGYGPAGAFLGCCELGINLFPEFRGAEIWYVYGQLMRTLHRLLGVECFFLTKYAMGMDNEEAIRTGVFWFYRKMGFRPTNPRVEELARAEEARMEATPGSRSDRRTLRRLARTEGILDLSGGRCRPVSFGKLGGAITRLISTEYDGDRATARQRTTAYAVRVLGIPNLRDWSADERRALGRIAPMLRLITDLPDWRDPERRRLVRLIRAKGARSEALASRISARHRRLQEFLRPYAL